MKNNENKYYLYGKHPVVSAVNNKNRKIHHIICTQNTEKFLIDNISPEILSKIKLEVKPPHKIDNILNRPEKAAHQGVIALTEPLNQPDIKSFYNSNILVFSDKITDPHNIGAIIRSCSAFGAAALITQEKNSPPENATIAKTSAGAIETTAYLHVNSLWKTIEEFKQQGFTSYGLVGGAETPINKINAQKKTIIVVGSEGKGLSSEVKKACDFLVEIPINEEIESLNASVATAVSLYQVNTDINS